MLAGCQPKESSPTMPETEGFESVVMAQDFLMELGEYWGYAKRIWTFKDDLPDYQTLNVRFGLTEAKTYDASNVSDGNGPQVILQIHHIFCSSALKMP